MTHLRQALESILQPHQVLDRPLDLAAYATDASFYRLIPRAVVRPDTVDDIRALFRFSHAEKIPLTFRTAGTSLSGQAISNGLIVDLSRGWRAIEPLDGGRRVRVQPGAIGGRVNRMLAAYGARIGPDPASIDACMIGGILSNNSSGMCCGVTQNSYHTLESMAFVLPSGTYIDASEAGAAEAFERAEPSVARGLTDLRHRVLANAPLAERIRRKYRTKNTTGYSLNAFLDFDSPLAILQHLIVGAEGTLAFIAHAVLRTISDLPVKYTGLLLFPSLASAAEAIAPLAAAGAAALELMDGAALRAVAGVPGVPAALAGLDETAAGVLVEFQEAEGAPLDALHTLAAQATSDLRLLEPARFSADPVERALLWRVRKGMYPSVGAVRARGTTLIVEDIAVPITALAPAVLDLQELFRVHGYRDAIVFGHARDGNLHYVLSQSFNDARAVNQYERFMSDVVRLVVERYDGALKAEHGTGRNMAPFVEAEWGGDALAIMRELKALLDPEGLLNPGVILNEDPRAHVKDLKPVPEVDEEVDRCVECGFCEPHCPSRDLTLTPRQRIVVRREMARSGFDRQALEQAFEYDGLDTCATDGLCALACPVGIDTGQLTKRLRAAGHSRAAATAAEWVAGRFGVTQVSARAAVRLSSVLAPLTSHVLPRRWRDLPAAAQPLPHTSPEGADAILFPSCVGRTLGALPGETERPGLAATLVAVAARTGVRLHVPPSAVKHCCGMPFSSKGFAAAHARAVNDTIDALWAASREGALPVLVDTSPCTYALLAGDALTHDNRDRLARMQVVDAVAYFRRSVLPHLSVRRRRPHVVLHPVCSLVKMGLVDDLDAIAAACSEHVSIPPSSGCCGFAGDRGWLVPELTASATREMAAEVRALHADGHYSSSRTCEIGMTRATGFSYESWVYLVEWATRRNAE